MAGSLQDQLRKSGLASAHDTRKAKSENRKRKRKQRAGHTDEDAARRAELAKANAERADRDRELNAQRQLEAEERALAAQIRQLVEMNKLSREDDSAEPVAFNYVEDGAIRHLYVSPDVSRALGDGKLALVRHVEGAAVVPRAAAEKIRLRDETQILVLNDRDEAAEDEDDPYADFKVPDDLTW